MEVHDSNSLASQKCKPCEGGVEACSIDEAQRQLVALGSNWILSDDGKLISRSWKLKNFVQAMQLISEVARIAEEDQHHPDLHITGYRLVKIELTTHAIQGLSENDFILAAKIDQASAKLGFR